MKRHFLILSEIDNSLRYWLRTLISSFYYRSACTVSDPTKKLSKLSTFLQLKNSKTVDKNISSQPKSTFFRKVSKSLKKWQKWEKRLSACFLSTNKSRPAHLFLSLSPAAFQCWRQKYFPFRNVFPLFTRILFPLWENIFEFCENARKLFEEIFCINSTFINLERSNLYLAWVVLHYLLQKEQNFAHFLKNILLCKILRHEYGPSGWWNSPRVWTNIDRV